MRWALLVSGMVKTQSAGRPRSQIKLGESYRRALERLEAMPENQSGADKTWVERAISRWRDHYARAVRVR
jgi:hypothetical protein